MAKRRLELICKFADLESIGIYNLTTFSNTNGQGNVYIYLKKSTLRGPPTTLQTF